VAAPLSTVDMKIKSGKEIPIEYRDKYEIRYFNKKLIVAEGAEVLNPAFDVTPAGYISGIITEKGVLKPPFKESIKKAFKDKI
ncbi:MAG: S-methyl-5-thioribose-1-phosphate isomerase, partial [Candidatus Hydrothermarchaeales archaeon]